MPLPRSLHSSSSIFHAPAQIPAFLLLLNLPCPCPDPCIPPSPKEEGWPPKNRAPVQMCLLCPEVALDGFRREQLEENGGGKAPSTSTEDRHRPRLLASVEDLSGPQPSVHASLVLSLLSLQNSEGCHAFCKDSPPQKSREDRALPRLPTSLEDLSGPWPCPHAFRCIQRTAGQSAEGCHALCKDQPPQKSKDCRPTRKPWKTFQVLSPPSRRLLYSLNLLCRSRRAVTWCALTHRLKRARRISHTHAYLQAWKTFQVLSPPLMPTHYTYL